MARRPTPQEIGVELAEFASLLLADCAQLEGLVRAFRQAIAPYCAEKELWLRPAEAEVTAGFARIAGLRGQLAGLREELPGAGPARPEQGAPRAKTQERGRVLRLLKEQHPDWSMAQVARAAAAERGEAITAETVRNTYRALGWDWPPPAGPMAAPGDNAAARPVPESPDRRELQAELRDAGRELEQSVNGLLSLVDPAWWQRDHRVRLAQNAVINAVSGLNWARRTLARLLEAERLAAVRAARQRERPARTPRGRPTVKTQERARVFRRLKERHPDWGMARVALEAQGELGEIVTAESVRHTYRVMGWPWPAGQRAR